MEPLFEIIPEAIFFQQTNLICEISLSSFTYIFENDIDRKFYGLYFFNFKDDEDIADQLKDIFKQQPLLSKNYKKVFICFSGEESALLPEELFHPGANETLFERIYGDVNDGIILTDLVTSKKIYNVYRIPSAIHKVIVNQFPLAAFNHQYSLLIKQAFDQTDLIKIIFYRDTFVAVVLKAGEVQLINTYSYLSGTDVVYHIKNIYRQFNIIDFKLCIAGMIDTGSALANELLHYFPHITFDELPGEYEFSDSLKQLPAHYFSHLFALASCV